MVFESLQPPYLLLSAPELLDPNFARAVVLIGHHTTEGAIGWIVNRVIDPKAIDLLPEPLGKSIHPETPLRLGGPVLVNGLIVLHRREVPNIESVEIAPGIRVSSSPDVLPELFASPPSGTPAGLLVFGYAGWGPGQLEREMEDGSWLVLPYEEDFAFPPDAEGLWERALARLGATPESVSTPPGGVN
ncbi:MAG TPA: YqgE/AlgH family protein [Thermoanaerobaculia bacterium]|nr:YqgE/AlgH family protein [Thermoanaerobaculia bacterium]